MPSPFDAPRMLSPSDHKSLTKRHEPYGDIGRNLTASSSDIIVSCQVLRADLCPEDIFGFRKCDQAHILVLINGLCEQNSFSITNSRERHVPFVDHFLMFSALDPSPSPEILDPGPTLSLRRKAHILNCRLF